MPQDRKLYYTPPSDEIFKEMKFACIKVWYDYDDTHGYATEKVARIKDIQNVGDNFMYMMAMFDHKNRRKVLNHVSEACADAFWARMPTTCGKCEKEGVPFDNEYGEICDECVEEMIF